MIIKNNMIQKSKPNNFYEFLDLIREKHYLYIGSKSLSTLHDVINGYMISCWVHNIEENLVPEWEGFNDFVAKHLNYYESTSGYRNMILEKCNMDEQKALEKFFELTELYRNSKTK
jgi:hypothetical protein